MHLAEYQAKEILAQLGVAVPEGGLAESPEEAAARAGALRCERFVVKAQIRAGGRGISGGIRFAPSPTGVRDAARDLLGRRLVTEQTGPEGEQVDRVWIEASVDDRHALYIALVVDERSAAPLLLGSREAGVEFERKAQADPGIVASLPLPADGSLDGVDLAGFLGGLGLEGAAAANTAALVTAAVRAAFEYDVLLLEINPLAILPDGRAVALDAKMVIDDNALFRHPELEAIAAQSIVNDQERVARANEINFVRLGGEIGLVVNGAGLGLATNDMVVDAGGKPANFMDIRTTATSFQIAKGVQLLLEDPSVRVILVNVHGGGMTVCDTIAEGISFAYSRAQRKPPIVFRAAGQNAEWARKIMKDRRLPFEAVADISGAVRRAIALARAGAA